MSAGSQKVSRYRVLRGKSVSEARRTVDQTIHEQQDDGVNSAPLRSSTLGSPGWRKRSRTQVNLETENSTNNLSHHFPLPSIPTPPISQKEHTNTTRPRAAIIPTPPIFGEQPSPTPLGKRRSNQALTSSLISAPIVTAVKTNNTSQDGTTTPVKRLEENSKKSGFEEIEHQKVEEEDPILLAQRLEAETDRILAEQKKLDLARLHQQLISTRSSTALGHSSNTRVHGRSPVFERFGFFSRARKSHVTLSPPSSTTTSVDFSRAQSMEPLLSPRTFMDQAFHFVTPPLTPMSPSNIQDRVSNGPDYFSQEYHLTLFFLSPEQHITVCYRGEYVNIPVTSDTSTVDILRRASEAMTNRINISASVVLESWAPHGLERRLRRYERIQDVLDSWNHDAQSSLLILHSLGPESDKDLDISSVPATDAPTPGLNLQLYHCSRPGKWHKRWITLLGDGQLIASKKPGAGPADRDSQRLCHLSSYDIYNLLSKVSPHIDDGQARSPRATPMKNLKPPKRYVFALKSQQKPTIYTDVSNFVHFLCTEDRDVAQEFHDRVHAWRSWYMVKTRRELQRRRPGDIEDDPEPQVEPEPKVEPEQEEDSETPHVDQAPQIEEAPQITPVRHNPRKSVFHVRVTPGHKVRVSIDEAPYTIGAFQPLVDLERFDKPIDEFGKDWIPASERLSMLSTAPGTDSGVSDATALTTPSTKDVLTMGKEDLDGSSPSEERRKRRDHKRSLASAAAAEGAGQQGVVAKEGEAGVTIAVSGPQTATPSAETSSVSNSNFTGDLQSIDSETLSREEPSPWLPSASEHTAKVKAEQARIDRINNPVFPPQRPVTSAGVTNHHAYYIAPPDRRGGRGGYRGQPVLPNNLVCHYRAATQWAEDASGSKFLEVPGAGHNGIRSMPSMPILVETTKSSRGGPMSNTSAVPVLWREQSLSSSHRPSTSGKDLSMSSHRPSTSGRDPSVSSHRPSTSGKDMSLSSSHRPSTSGRDHSSHSASSSRRPSTSSGDRQSRQQNGRTGSGSSPSRNLGGVNSTQGGDLPPMPPVPSHLRPFAKDGRGEAGAAPGSRMLIRSSTTLR